MACSSSSLDLSSAEPDSDSADSRSTASSSTPSATLSLLDTLHAPKLSELSRKWKVQENPSAGEEKEKGNY